MIRVKDLTCGYERSVLKAVSFTSKHNLVILGANGAGKSTLAKALCGLLEAEGEIEINQEKLSELTPKERAKSITYIPPKLESYDRHITLFEFVLMGRHPYKSPFSNYTQEEQAYVRSLLEQTSLDLEQKLGTLSSGQQQLLLITQALAQESKVILFDEPTANLDPKHALDFYRQLKNLDKTTQKVVITHDINLAFSLEYEVLFIQDGHAVHYKEPRDFFTPANLHNCYGVTFTHSGSMFGIQYA